ncbi:PAS/PAC sensor signal transduction histidine kinase [Candidatus Sulfopaludibacter sp. SbA3]|nr:PAS/PAC sensor signal transduction histidine kinase [Candidatus Sulfopaludibacter sp. SbA3]
MTLQARLTLYFVLLAVLMVTTISAINLGNEMQAKFDDTLTRAVSFRRLAMSAVKEALDRDRTLPIQEALRRPALVDYFQNIAFDSGEIEELAVVDPDTNLILLDTDPGAVGQEREKFADFEPLVKQAGWYQKLRALRNPTGRYQLETPLEAPPFRLSVRAVINPGLIEDDILRSLKQNGKVALGALVGAVIATFLFSTVAFRPLGVLRRQLDLVMSGHFEPEIPAEGKPGSNEFSIMASKVSLLGQRLRGAQFEVSDLRGNIDRLLQDLEDAVFIFNREHRLVFVSGSVKKFLGKERADLGDAGMEDIFPSSTALGLLIAHAAETGGAVRNRRVAGVLLSVDLLANAPGAPRDGSGFLVRLRDPEAQRKIGRELQTADRMAAISRISGGVAHEVKNPLNAMLLHVEVARAKLSHGDTDVAPQMEIISREILRLDRVVKTFLDFTRPVELNLTQVPLPELVGEIVDLARPQADAARIRISAHQESEGAEVRIDRDLLKQAVLNIVVNAMQAMPDGGELRFESSVREDTAEIRVGDTGAGIPPELRDKIFRLYYTTKKDGSGIGLAMTFRIVQLHDGTIDFTSEPGKGTTFFIRLPIAV